MSHVGMVTSVGSVVEHTRPRLLFTDAPLQHQRIIADGVQYCDMIFCETKWNQLRSHFGSHKLPANVGAFPLKSNAQQSDVDCQNLH